MYDDGYVFTADLIAFVEWQDLPPSLHPFARSASWRDGVRLRRDARLMVLRIREAPDAYHAIIINNGTTIADIEAQIRRDLEVVRLSAETSDILGELLQRSQGGEFTYFMSCDVSKV